jgi:hypothetical protein
MMNSGHKAWYAGDAKIELQEDIRQAMDEITSDISESDPLRATVGAGGNSITFQIPIDENGTGTWQDIDGDGTADFYLQNTLDAAGDVQWGGYLMREDPSVPSNLLPNGPRLGRTIIYLLVTDELRRRVVDSTGTIIEEVPLADDIQNLVFTRVSNNVIMVNINSRKTSLGREPVNYTLTTDIYLRN